MLQRSALVEFLLQRDEGGFVRAVRDAILRRAHSHNLNRDDYLDRFFPATRWALGQAVSFQGLKVLDRDKLCGLISVLRISLEELFDPDSRSSPWDRWKTGATAAVVFGKREVEIPAVSKKMVQLAVGGRDLHAFSDLCDQLFVELKVECRVQTHIVPAKLSRVAAKKYLHELCSQPEIQAVIVVGSPIVNPLAEPIASAILAPTRLKRMPARFRWSFNWTKSRLPFPRKPVLSESAQVEQRDEGIIVDERRFLPRVHDDIVADRLQRGDKGPFKDCGMLIVDESCESGPIRILCAGHGGCGTWATVRGLGQRHYLAMRLHQSRNSQDSPIGPRRLLEVVEVDRVKPDDGRPAKLFDDDLIFDQEYGVGWRFV